MSASFHSTRPADARVTVAIIRISVDFPAPFGPSNPTTPGPSSSRKSRNPHTFPAYCLLTPSITSLMNRPLLPHRQSGARLRIYQH